MQAILGLLVSAGLAAGAPRVFPEPRQMTATGADFLVDGNTVILVPLRASPADLRLAGMLAAELAGRHGAGVRQEAAASLPPARRYLLIGDTANPLVQAYASAHGLELTAASPGPEGYVLTVTPSAVVVAGSDERGAFYGLQSLRQLVASQAGRVRIPGVQIRDWPYRPFRGIKLYLPGRDHIGFFKRFVRDYMALYKFNRLILEMNAAMRLDRHPEVNAGWLDLARDLQFRRLNEPPGIWAHNVNSVHQDTADGGILEKAEVAGLVRWAESNYIEVIPELPSLSHSYYLLTRHRELAEIPQEQWPDTYCPLLPGSYKLLFDVYDEFIDVMKPKMVQAGHDEWRMPWGVCPRCRDKDPRELYAQDINRIHDYLQRKGIRMAIWSDYLLENVRGVKFLQPRGRQYRIPGALSPEQVRRLIPRDILMFNWVWGYTADPKVPPITNEQRLSEWGFQSIYANMFSGIENFAARTREAPRIIGGEPSAWLATTEFNLGKDRVADFALCGGLLWSGRDLTRARQTRMLDELMPEIRRNLSGTVEPSATEAVLPLEIHSAVQAGASAADMPAWKPGRVSRGRLVFHLAGSGAASSQPIAIGQDVTSIAFLHALARPAESSQGYTMLFDFEDSADLLGWYEIEYQDGLVTTIPLRYKWNILDWKNASGQVAYDADAVDAGNGVTLYAFEWTNPRLGKVIQQVRLKASSGFRNPRGKLIPDNAVILAAVSVVPKRVRTQPPDPPLPH